MKSYKHRHLFWRLPVMLAIIAVASLVVMALWNAILPDLLHVQPVNYLQAAGLLVLARLLFGGFRGFHGFHAHAHPHSHHFRERWDNLKPEEREEVFKNWDKLRPLWRNPRTEYERDKS